MNDPCSVVKFDCFLKKKWGKICTSATPPYFCRYIKIATKFPLSVSTFIRPVFFEDPLISTCISEPNLNSLHPHRRDQYR